MRLFYLCLALTTAFPVLNEAIDTSSALATTGDEPNDLIGSFEKRRGPRFHRLRSKFSDLWESNSNSRSSESSKSSFSQSGGFGSSGIDIGKSAKGGGGGGHGSGSSSSSSSGGKGGSSSSGGKGGSSSSRSGSTAGKSYQPANNAGKSYGSSAKDYSTSKSPPPPYSRTDPNAPPAYSPSRGQSYGQRGTTPTYWNGQYYPYRSFGYTPFLPLGFAAPFLLAGPFGYYGNYCDRRGANCTTNSIYVNGTRNENGDLVNGTFYTVKWENGSYHTVSGDRNTTYANYSILPDHPNIAVNGTSIRNESSYTYATINPNMTANGTELVYNASAENAGTHNAKPAGSAYIGAALVATFGLIV